MTKGIELGRFDKPLILEQDGNIESNVHDTFAEGFVEDMGPNEIRRRPADKATQATTDKSEDSPYEPGSNLLVSAWIEHEKWLRRCSIFFTAAVAVHWLAFFFVALLLAREMVRLSLSSTSWEFNGEISVGAFSIMGILVFSCRRTHRFCDAAYQRHDRFVEVRLIENIAIRDQVLAAMLTAEHRSLVSSVVRAGAGHEHPGAIQDSQEPIQKEPAETDEPQKDGLRREPGRARNLYDEVSLRQR